MICILTPEAAVLAQEPMSKAKQTKMGQLALSDAVTAALREQPDHQNCPRQMGICQTTNTAGGGLGRSETECEFAAWSFC